MYKIIFFMIFSFGAGTKLNAQIEDSLLLPSQSLKVNDSLIRNTTELLGKKILVVILPAEQIEVNASFLKQLDTVSKTYKDRLTIVAVPSEEDGFSTDSALAKHYYDSLLGKQIILLQGSYTHNNSATQDSLLTWCTHRTHNGHFDEDIKGVKQLFWISEEGELYAVFGPENPLDDEMTKTMIRRSSQ